MKVTPDSRRSTMKALPRKRRRLLLTLTMLVPVIFFLLLEAVLRIADYGPDISMFTTEIINGRAYRLPNPEVKNRYFSRFRLNATASADYFPEQKAPGTFRIFCLGGSTTVGYPYWYNGAVSSFLRDRLKKAFPGHTIEVINVGMTATNSFTVLDMAREVLRMNPDLLVVYDGHNEFYGAMGYASNESLGHARWLTLASLRLIHVRTFLLIRDLVSRAAEMLGGSGPTARSAGTLMETLAQGQTIVYRSPAYEGCLEHFRANLTDLRSLCAEAHIPILLGTQVSNLRDLQPFVSDPSAGLTTQARKAYSSALAAANASSKAGQFSDAARFYRQGITIDSFSAGAHYGLAGSLDRLGDRREALKEYLVARDYDQLRFRASTDFNEAIRDAADGSTMFVADIERAFMAESPDSLIGKTLITEHLHPNSRGGFIMAREYAKLMRRCRTFGGDAEWLRADSLSEEALWQERPVTELDEMIAARRTEILTSGWPFKSQTPIVDAVRPGDTLGQIVEEVTRGRWSWKQAHEEAAAYYLSRHDLQRAEREYAVVVNQFPGIDVQSYLRLARVCLSQKKIPEAKEALLASLEISPTILAYRDLGDIALEAGSLDEARGCYEKVLGFSQTLSEQVENGYLLALALERAGNRERSKAELLRILKLKPDYRPAVVLLQQIASQPEKK
jgi:tetratricopeptide (TPR) repeat protein